MLCEVCAAAAAQTIYYCTILPQTLLSSWRIGDFCSRCYVRVMYCSSNSLFAQHMHKTFEFTNWTNLQQVLCEVYVLLLLKQSIAQHFHKPLSSPRIGHFPSAADFMWGMCCCYSNNLLHNTSTNLWVLQQSETNAPDVMWPVCVATEIISIARHFHKPLSSPRIGHFLQQTMLCELCAATGTIIYCTSVPQTLEFLTDLDTYCSRWCCVSCMCCCYWNNNLLHNTSTTLWGSQIGHFCSRFHVRYVLLSNNVLHPVCKQYIRVIRKVSFGLGPELVFPPILMVNFYPVFPFSWAPALLLHILHCSYMDNYYNYCRTLCIKCWVSAFHTQI
jgi:hypothetical protein